MDERFRDDGSAFEMELPARWLQFNAGRPDLVITRDGLRLERVTVRAVDVGAELKGTKRVYRADMTAYDVAELALSLIAAADETRDFRVTRIDACRIAGHDGFVADATFADQHGLAMRLRTHGAIIPARRGKGEARVIQVFYGAPARAYFERFLPVVERMVESGRVATEH